MKNITSVQKTTTTKQIQKISGHCKKSTVNVLSLC